MKDIDKPLKDLLDIIHFTEKVSTKIHGILDESKILKVVKQEFEKSNQYSMSINLLSDDKSKLEVTEVSISSEKIRKAEKVTGLQLAGFSIDLNKSRYYRQVVHEGKTLQATFEELVTEILPAPIARIVPKILGYQEKSSILTPLTCYGEIIGVFSVSSTGMAEYFVPSVKSLAQHISAALELSNEYSKRKQTEEALRTNEKKYRTVFENMTDMYYCADLQGNLVLVSPSGADLLGYENLEDLIGENIADKFYYQPKERENFLEMLKEHGEVTNYEIILKKKDGTPVVGETNSRLVYDDAQNPMAVEGIFRDISERKITEEKLRESEEKFRGIAERSFDGIYEMDLTGKVIYASPSLERITGYTREEIEGSSFQQFVPEESILSALEGLSAIVEGKNVTGLQVDFIQKDQSIATVEINASPVFKDGQVVGAQGVVRDITHRKKVEEELQKYRFHLEELVEKRTAELNKMNKKLQQEIKERKQIELSLAAEKERLSVTLRSIGDGVITTDTKGSIVLMNKVAEQLTGYTQEEAVKKPLNTVFHIISEKTRIQCNNPVERVLNEGKVVGLANDTVLISQDGTERVIADSGAPIRDKDSKIIGVVLVFRDVTEKQRMEQELLRAQKLESVSVLAGGIAHDFNNILTAILTNANLARMQAEDNKILGKLTKIEKASLQAKELTQQLLTFSKGGAPVKETTLITELIKESASFALRGSNVRCHFYFPDNVWTVHVDQGQISQVINNIIINADQAMPEGGIIRVKAENVTAKKGIPVRPGQYVKISITDQGMGISEQYLQKIFDPYFTTKQKGSGLGLSTSYSIIKKHDGHITAESHVGKGTTFYVWLPASQEEKKRTEKTSKAVKGEGKVLLMDDEDSVREAASEILQYLGYTVVGAKTGEEAITLYKKALQKKPFDAVVMDLTIPGGMGGKEAVEELLKIDKNLKAIVASGYSTDPVMAQYKEHGFRGVVIKPYSIEDLSTVLHTVINEK
ncbi:MAG: PAS domain S-box protein [Candidatus Methanofastidiosia archaeon]|jgi:PAS domain S-box-containing protein